MLIQQSAIEVVKLGGVGVIALIDCVIFVMQVLPKLIALIVDLLVTVFGVVLGVLLVYVLIAGA